ncbi:MAG: TAXI family TRAP transporter solute-binding subunit [Candidatus Marinarcus sp.]|uniref:TAXI family TRAP transporter solute-binding subunit n=1 Tax=Candidatus Marinarcus sp. TaxID=3100987 RepID=UPI003B007641
MNNFLKIYLPIFIFVFLAFFVTSRFIEPAPEKKLIIAAGSLDGTYYKTAMEYKKLLEQDKVEVTILQTAGSIENAQLLEAKKADIAFIQNGILTSKQKENLESLASIYYEPLWVFYKSKGFQINYIIELIGQKTSIGTQGSGTQDLSLTILNDNGINESNSTLLNYTTQDAKEALLKGEIDAMVLVVSPNAPIIKELLENPTINILSIKRARAYSQKYSFLTTLTLYEGTMDLYKNLPYNNINLLATTANLVSREGISDELIRLFLKKVKMTHTKKTLFSQENEFPNLNNLETKINSEAQKYFENGDSWLESIFPYWIASNIDRLKILIIPFLTLLFPLFKGVMPLYRWTMRSKIYKWYDDINDIDKTIPRLTHEELLSNLATIENLKIEISNQTKVPLAFMGEYYNLLLHVEMVITKIKEKLKTNSL